MWVVSEYLWRCVGGAAAEAAALECRPARVKTCESKDLRLYLRDSTEPRHLNASHATLSLLHLPLLLLPSLTCTSSLLFFTCTFTQLSWLNTLLSFYMGLCLHIITHSQLLTSLLTLLPSFSSSVCGFYPVPLLWLLKPHFFLLSSTIHQLYYNFSSHSNHSSPAQPLSLLWSRHFTSWTLYWWADQFNQVCLITSSSTLPPGTALQTMLCTNLKPCLLTTIFTRQTLLFLSLLPIILSSCSLLYFLFALSFSCALANCFVLQPHPTAWILFATTTWLSTYIL